MAVLRAYLDDSGDGDSPSETYLTIGGWVADMDSWKYFDVARGSLSTNSKFRTCI